MPEPALTLLQKLVQINSVTPTSQSKWAEEGGEETLALWLKDYLQQYNFFCELDYVLPGRPNLIARPPRFDESLPTIAFEAHLDTVDVEGMTVDPFAAVIRDGALWGRGACDVKGPMAVMLTSLIKWTLESRRPKFNAIFIGTMGEETGTLGAKHLAQQRLPLDMILVGEPTLMNPVIGHKGVWRFAIETKGRSCHSSRPQEGENAIEAMIPILQLIQGKIKSEFERQAENTLSITTLHAGNTINIIPEKCRAEVDARFRNGTDVAAFRHILQTELKKFGNNNQYIEIQDYPAFNAVDGSVLLEMLETALEQENMAKSHLYEPWYSDAGHLSLAGYDVIVWGPGDIRHAHTSEEHIAIEQVSAGERVLDRFLRICEDHYGE